MGIRRSKIQKVATRAITVDQIAELMDGRGYDMGEVLTGKPAFTSEAERRDFWNRFKGRVYATMKECGRFHKHPAAYYEYEDYTSEELEADRKYFGKDWKPGKRRTAGKSDR